MWDIMATREQKLEAKKRYYQKNKNKLNLESKENNLRLRCEKKNFIIESLGSKCCECGTTNDLEIDHINPGLKKDRKSLYACSWERIKDEMDNLQLLCNECHHKKSQLQKNASWFYFKNLPLEEQNKIMEQFKLEGSNLPSWSPQDKG
jgi:5-methylcytosine-specific restriction endonuclease McrA